MDCRNTVNVSPCTTEVAMFLPISDRLHIAMCCGFCVRSIDGGVHRQRMHLAAIGRLGADMFTVFHLIPRSCLVVNNQHAGATVAGALVGN